MNAKKDNIKKTSFPIKCAECGEKVRRFHDYSMLRHACGCRVYDEYLQPTFLLWEAKQYLNFLEYRRRKVELNFIISQEPNEDQLSYIER